MSSCVAVNWLDHSRTFREQGVDENETLLLRRKFFYSDQNVDSRDPVQLNLLYVQVQYWILRRWGWWAFRKLWLWLVVGRSWAPALTVSVTRTFQSGWVVVQVGVHCELAIQRWAFVCLPGGVLMATTASLCLASQHLPGSSLHTHYSFRTSHLEYKDGYWSENQYFLLTERYYSLSNLLCFYH